MIANARLAAYRALRVVNSHKADLPSAIASVRSILTDPRDDALAFDIVTGSLRWQAKLDHVISHVRQRPLTTFDVEVLDILRISVYQLLHHDRVPAHAIVDDAVKLTRLARKSSAAGLVNAVLRNIYRQRGRLPIPCMPANGGREDILNYLSVALSHPRWLATRWLNRYGLERAIAWEKFNDTPAPIVLRANRRNGTREHLAASLASHGIQTKHTCYSPDGLIVTKGNPLRSSLTETGAFVVQDEASQLITLLATVQPGERVLDTCASPGGKTIALADDMNNDGLLVAADVRRQRLTLLSQTLSQNHVSSASIIRLDLQKGLPFSNNFDCVFVDVPCSGLGVIRRDPEIRWRRTEADLDRFHKLQTTMLGHAASGVRPGGRLIYGTCSSEPEENEEVIEEFLRHNSDFNLQDFRENDQSLSSELNTIFDQKGQLRTSPAEHGLDAFFAARLVRLST